MASTLSPHAVADRTPRTQWRRDASQLVRRRMEALLLVMVCFSPWALGAAGPTFEFILYAGVALLLVTWGARMLLEGQLSWKKCPVALSLAALTLYALWQLIPLPQDLLRRLSPATVRMVEQLLPAQPEILPFGEIKEEPVLPPGSTLSFYPGRTWQELVRLLAVCSLFVVVRNNLASAGSLRRLSIAMLVNGALLSLFALVQFFTSPADTLYWTWPAPGTIFGPFVCRNHFAFYMNLCVGLSVGLLLARERGEQGKQQSARFPKQHGSLTGLSGSRTLLQDPAALWTIAGLTLMISSVAFCASRGGIVAMLSGWIGLLLMHNLLSVRFRRGGAILLILSLVLALLTWFGLGRVQARLATLWGKEALQEGRLELWSRVLPVAKDFSIWGTGYGTFPLIEPLYRIDPRDEEVWSNAENDYLEALVEGGIVRLLLSVLAIGLVFRLGYRAVRSDEGPGVSALAMGALFGFITMVIQSFVDFGLHIPAIALLATVLCAHLCARGGSRGPTSVFSLRLRGLAPAGGAMVAVLFGLVLTYEGWRAYQVQEFRLAASNPGCPSDPANYLHRIDRLAAAARLAPESARLQVELALAHYERFRNERQKLRLRGQLVDAVHAVGEFTPVRCPTVVTPWVRAAMLAGSATAEARQEPSKADKSELIRKYLAPALRHFLQARDRCPLLPEPHRCIAENSDELEQGDACIAYLERTRLLVPYSPALWYLCGDERLDEQSHQTWKDWRRCLELSDRYVAPILQASAARLRPQEILEWVLPADPKILLAAALELYPEPAEERHVFLDRALTLFEQRPAPLRPEELHIKALIECALDRTEEAVATYRAALDRDLHQVPWRFELARLLWEQRRFKESRRELFTILSEQSQHSDARELLIRVEHQIALGN